MPKSPPGRPRRYDDGTERRLLVDAAIRVIERNDYADISLEAVLSEAGLSTRAFYRHFQSKEALLETFMLQEAEAMARSLARAVAAAPGPRQAVDAWLERFLDVFFVPRRARRAALLASAAARVSGPSMTTMAEMRRIVCAPLAGALRAGHEQGALRSVQPDADAFSIHALVMASIEASDGEADRESTRQHVLRFVEPALRPGKKAPLQNM